MPKSLDDYMNDPDLANEPMALREIHAIRLKIQDETQGMSFEERRAFYTEGTAHFFASMESPPPYASPSGETD